MGFWLSDCPGPQSEAAGKSDECQGCPNQEVCATAPKGPDLGNDMLSYAFLNGKLLLSIFYCQSLPLSTATQIVLFMHGNQCSQCASMYLINFVTVSCRGESQYNWLNLTIWGKIWGYQ